MNFAHSSAKIIGLAAVAIVLFCCLQGCKKGTACPEDFMEKPAAIVSVTGPETLTVGERAAINIGVKNEEGICVVAVKADAENTGLDTITIDAALQYRQAGATGCDCLSEPQIYTLIYFTPTTSGNYYFKVRKKLDSSMNPVDSTPSFEINVP